MSKRRKKNSRSPRRPEVTFLKIYEDDKNPWPTPYYMCGMCGHAVAAKDVETHAKKAHNASAYRILEIDDTPLTEEEAEELQRSGSLGTEAGSNLPESIPGDDGSGSGEGQSTINNEISIEPTSVTGSV